jgi:hypothetical protein
MFDVPVGNATDQNNIAGVRTNVKPPAGGSAGLDSSEQVGRAEQQHVILDGLYMQVRGETLAGK